MPVAGVPLSTPVLELKLTFGGNVPLSLIVGGGVPLTVIATLLAVPTTKLAVLPLVNVGAIGGGETAVNWTGILNSLSVPALPMARTDHSYLESRVSGVLLV